MLFAIICDDKPGALEIRKANRPDHVAYLKSTGAVLAGPFTDEAGEMCGSLVVIEAADRAAAEAWAEADPYAEGRPLRASQHPPLDPRHRLTGHTHAPTRLAQATRPAPSRASACPWDGAPTPPQRALCPHKHPPPDRRTNVDKAPARPERAGARPAPSARFRAGVRISGRRIKACPLSSR